MNKQYVLGIGLNMLNAQAILLEEGGKVAYCLDRKRNNTTANDTIKVLLELIETILNKTKKFKKNICGIEIGRAHV